MNGKDHYTPSRRSILRSISTASLGTVALSTPTLADNHRPEKSDIILFENLTPKAKRQFRRSLSQGQITHYAGPQPNDEETLAEQLMRNLYVQYRGDIYYLNPSIAAESVYDVRLTLAGDGVTENPTETATYSSLSSRAQRVIRAALSNGRYKTRGDDGFPTDIVFDYRYLEKDGTRYKLNSVHLDVPIHTLRPEKLEKPRE